jgi:LysM repeat protein
LLGLGFGLLQMINRPEPSPAVMAMSQVEPGTTLDAAAIGPSVPLVVGPGSSAAAGPAETRPREIRATASVIEPNYTVEAGDTLGRIAVRFNTTVERIQALNNLADPRALRIGTKLIIPPPL